MFIVLCNMKSIIMLCNMMISFIMLYNLILSNIMLHNIVLHNIVLNNTMLRTSMQTFPPADTVPACPAANARNVDLRAAKRHCTPHARREDPDPLLLLLL